eukprot:2198916-Pyramimonas_sp.AAC.1
MFSISPEFPPCYACAMLEPSYGRERVRGLPSRSRVLVPPMRHLRSLSNEIGTEASEVSVDGRNHCSPAAWLEQFGGVRLCRSFR